MRTGAHGRTGVRDVGRTVVRSTGGTLHRLLRSHAGNGTTGLGHLGLRHGCHARTSRLRHRSRAGALCAHARLRTGRLHGALLLSRSTKRGRGGCTAGHVLGKLRATLEAELAGIGVVVSAVTAKHDGSFPAPGALLCDLNELGVLGRGVKRPKRRRLATIICHKERGAVEPQRRG